jgi:hypothetical protein
MAPRIAHSNLELKDDAKPSYRALALFLVYGSEAILPKDLEYGALRIKAFNEKGKEASLEDALDQLEEAHDVVLLHSAKYQ